MSWRTISRKKPNIKFFWKALTSSTRSIKKLESTWQDKNKLMSLESNLRKQDKKLTSRNAKSLKELNGSKILKTAQTRSSSKKTSQKGLLRFDELRKSGAIKIETPRRKIIIRKSAPQ